MKAVLSGILVYAMLFGSACAAEVLDMQGLAIRHLKPGAVFDGPCTRIQQTLTPGEAFSDAVPSSDIEAVEVQADEIALPSPVVLYILKEGKFGELTHPIAVPQAPAIRVMLKKNRCLQMNVLIDPANNQINSVATDIGTLLVPDMPADCIAHIPHIMPGMTRAEVEKNMKTDGGISVPFASERYVVQPCGNGVNVMKVNLAFKPVGMSDTVYLEGKWLRPATNPQDIIMRVSPYYLDAPFAD